MTFTASNGTAFEITADPTAGSCTQVLYLGTDNSTYYLEVTFNEDGSPWYIGQSGRVVDATESECQRGYFPERSAGQTTQAPGNWSVLSHARGGYPPHGLRPPRPSGTADGVKHELRGEGAAEDVPNWFDSVLGHICKSLTCAYSLSSLGRAGYTPGHGHTCLCPSQTPPPCGYCDTAGSWRGRSSCRLRGLPVELGGPALLAGHPG